MLHAPNSRLPSPNPEPPSSLRTFQRCPRPACAALTLSTSRKRDSGSHLLPASLSLNRQLSRISFASVSTVLEIESAITNLPKKEFWELATWFDDVKNRAWDEQMEADAAAGKLDFLFEEAAAERAKRKLKDWPPAQ